MTRSPLDRGLLGVFGAPALCSLKKNALIFDRLLYPDPRSYCEFLLKCLPSGHTLTRLEQRLRSKNLIAEGTEFAWLIEQKIVEIASGDEFEEAVSHLPMILAWDEMHQSPSAFLSAFQFQFAIRAWLGSERLRVGCKLPCVPLIAWDTLSAIAGAPETRRPDDWRSLMLRLLEGDEPRTAADTIQIVLQSVPEPDELTDWERIIEFRNDPDSQHKLLALRRWMSRVARAEWSAGEISEELTWALAEYEAHMRLHEMKVNTGTLETVLTVAGEVAEDLVKFKFGKLAKLPFVLKHRKLDLLEAEMKAPGREVAYIAKARREFPSDEDQT